MLAKEIKNFNQSVAVVGYDKNGELIMWGTAKHCEVIKIELTNESLKVFVDYERKKC